MKAFLRFLMVITVVVVCCAAKVGAEWRIDIESKTVDAGATDVTVDITAYWDLPMTGFTLPLVVREIDPGAFWTGDLPYDTEGTAACHPYSRGVTWRWGTWAVLMEQVRPMLPDQAFTCDPRIDTLYDGVAPDQLLISASSIIGVLAKPNGQKAVTLTFDVSDVAGQFELDTACFTTRAIKVFMNDDQPVPINHADDPDFTFNKGVITIQDITQNDIDGDGVDDVDDNCPYVYNPGQENSDSDVYGDSCDNCPLIDNPEQADRDGDGYGDTCDVCPDVYNPDQSPDSCDNAILEIEDAVPADYALLQNYPNPFNASTLIEFTVREGGYARLEVYDILGRNVATLVDGFVPAGRSQAVWNGTDARGNTLSSGIYFYRFTTSDFTALKKMVLMK